MGFEILTAVKIHIVAFWVMTTSKLIHMVTFQACEKGSVRVPVVIPDTVTLSPWLCSEICGKC